MSARVLNSSSTKAESKGPALAPVGILKDACQAFLQDEHSARRHFDGSLSTRLLGDHERSIGPLTNEQVIVDVFPRRAEQSRDIIACLAASDRGNGSFSAVAQEREPPPGLYLANSLYWNLGTSTLVAKQPSGSNVVD